MALSFLWKELDSFPELFVNDFERFFSVMLIHAQHNYLYVDSIPTPSANMESLKMASRLRKYTLVIIDMQPRFIAAQSRSLIGNIEEEIRRAKDLGNHIMFVRFANCGKITSSLLEAAQQNYTNVSVVTKVDQDGGHEVLQALSKRAIHTNVRTNLRICGVNTDQCVESTAYTIAKAYPKRFKIEIVDKGCGTGLTYDHKKALDRLNKKPNIRIDRAA
jgi:nicotinamidase-related amidase